MNKGGQPAPQISTGSGSEEAQQGVWGRVAPGNGALPAGAPPRCSCAGSPGASVCPAASGSCDGIAAWRSLWDEGFSRAGLVPARSPHAGRRGPAS